MKGYKASYSGKCQSLKYEVGKTYTFHGDIEICDRGFHFCENPADTLKYYPYDEDLKLFEVEALGKCITEGNKTVTDKIKIIKEAPLSVAGIEVEYDKNGNEIHFRNSDGREKWREYDEDGNVIHLRNSNGYERWREYDEDGNVIHYRDSKGVEEWIEYDEDGNVIHYRSNNGYEWWSEYDENGNDIHFRDSDGREKWREYDEEGSLIHYRDSDVEEWSIEIT